MAAWVETVITSVQAWDLSTLVSSLVYVAIVALFVVAYFRCVRPVIYCRAKLKRAIREVKRRPAEQPWQDKNFLGKGTLHSAWGEYLNSRNFADNNYHNASPLENYINEDTVVNEPGRVALSDAMPGLMVSLGFLGTLVGLMMGLADFDMSNTDTTMSAIRQVVEGMRYAFMTSIVGVVGSISYSVISRAAQGSARNALSRFYEIMHRQAGVQAVDPLTQITIYQQEQTSLVQTMAEDLTGAMTDRIGAVLEMALQPIQSSLDDFVRAATREQVRAVDAMVNRFVDNMDASLSRQMSHLADTLEKTCRWQQDTAKHVNDVMEGIKRVSYDIVQIQQTAESMIVKFDGYIHRLGAAQTQVDDGYATVASAARAMDASAKQQFECVAQLTELHEALDKSILRFRDEAAAFSIKTAEEAAGRISEVQAELAEALPVLRAEAEACAKSVSQAQAAGAEALRQAADEMRVNGKVLSSAHNTFIKGMNQELERTFEIFSRDLNEITDRFKETIESLDAAVRDVPALLREGSDALRDEVDRLRGPR